LQGSIFERGAATAGGRRSRRAAALILAAVTACAMVLAPVVASAADGDGDDDGKPKAKPAFPTTYLDLSTSYATVPAGVIALGFGFAGQFATLPGVGLPATRALGVNAPLTFDINDRVSVWAGVHGSMIQPEGGSWTSFIIDSWHVGTQIEVYQQKGGLFPTVTVQETVASATSGGPFATTSFTTVLELNEALNKDETRGLLAGMQAVNVVVDSSLAKVNPYFIGYVGGYYEWDNDWKITGRAGVQSFGGAQLLGVTLAQPFTQPLIRFDVDLMDDNDNRLFGVWAQIAWTPKPSYLLTLRTPIFAVRN